MGACVNKKKSENLIKTQANKPKPETLVKISRDDSKISIKENLKTELPKKDSDSTKEKKGKEPNLIMSHIDPVKNSNLTLQNNESQIIKNTKDKELIENETYEMKVIDVKIEADIKQNAKDEIYENYKTCNKLNDTLEKLMDTESVVDENTIEDNPFKIFLPQPEPLYYLA
jgi:hypothetical protein